MRIVNRDSDYSKEVIDFLGDIEKKLEDYNITDIENEMDSNSETELSNQLDMLYNDWDEMYKSFRVEEALRVHQEIISKISVLRKRSLSLRDTLYECIYVMVGEEDHSFGNLITIRSDGIYHFNSSRKLNLYNLPFHDDIKKYLLSICKNKYKEDLKKIFEVLQDYSSLLRFVYLESDNDALEINCMKEIEKELEEAIKYSDIDTISEYKSYIIYKARPHSNLIYTCIRGDFDDEDAAVEEDNYNTFGPGFSEHIIYSDKRDEKSTIENIERNISLIRDLLDVIYTVRDIYDELVDNLFSLEEEVLEPIEKIAVSRNI